MLKIITRNSLTKPATAIWFCGEIPCTFWSWNRAGYAYYAANEAEKASHINIVNVQGFGKFGRIYIAGDEAEVVESQKIAEARLESLSGQ